MLEICWGLRLVEARALDGGLEFPDVELSAEGKGERCYSVTRNGMSLLLVYGSIFSRPWTGWSPCRAVYRRCSSELTRPSHRLGMSTPLEEIYSLQEDDLREHAEHNVEEGLQN